MKKLFLLVLLAVIFLGYSNSNAQQIKFMALGGYSLPMGELKGDYPPDPNANPGNYLMKNGFNAGGAFKYFFDKKMSMGIVLSGVYNGFSQSVDNPLTGISNSKWKINIFQVGLGFEYIFPVKGTIRPYAGLDLTGNFISGKATYTPTGGSETDGYTLKSATRFGFNVGAGAEFMISKEIGLNVGAKYQFFNLIGKDYDSTFTAATVPEFALNDKEYTMGGVTQKAKNMMGLQIYGGVTLYLDKLFKK